MFVRWRKKNRIEKKKTKNNKVHHQLTLAAQNSLKVHHHSWPYIVAHFYTNYVIHSMFFAFNLNFHIFCSVDFYILIRFQRHNERYNTEKNYTLIVYFFVSSRLVGSVVIRIVGYAQKTLIIYGRFSICKSWQITTFNMHINNFGGILCACEAFLF